MLKTFDPVSTFLTLSFSNETLMKILWEKTGHLYMQYGADYLFT